MRATCLKKTAESKNAIEETVLFTHISNTLNAEIIVRFSKRLQDKHS